MIRNNENTDNNGCNLCPRMCNVNRHTGTWLLSYDRPGLRWQGQHFICGKSLVYRENVEAEPYFSAVVH